MFAMPRYVIKSGTLVVEEGQLRRAPATHRLHVRPQYDAAVMRDVSSWFDRYGTIALANYPVAPPRDAPVPVGASA
jgi:formylmethanofuran dehydrogenase subunit A